MDTLTFVTENKGKFSEAKKILENFNLKQHPMDLKEIQSHSVEEISEYKADSVRDVSGPFFVEDTGLYIDALKGFPGPYAKQVFHTIGNEGILKLMEGKKDRRACFRAAVTYKDGKMKKTFTGETCGTISDEQRGARGFGYDPIFIPEGHDKTLAEMTRDEKNTLSHRAKAIKKMAMFLSGRLL